jgi:ParB-like chromosome segregation protein Spo0J
MKVENISIKDLNFAEYNPREITDKSFEDLKKSIEQFGFVEPVVVNKNNMEIIGGHMRVRAAKDLGIEEVPVVFVELDEKESKLLNLALNRIQGRWAADKLSELITELRAVEGADLSLSGFEDWELDYYNVGMDSPNLEIDPSDIIGKQPGESYVLLFTFEKEEDAIKASAFFNEGKYIKSNDGQKLLDLIGA